jgi:hypothetical protein
VQLFSSDENVPGVFAVGQVATGIFVLAQFGTGVFVIAQFGRGVFVLAQFAVGFVAVGQFAAGVFSTGGMGAIGGRSFFGLPMIALLPRLRWPRAEAGPAPTETTLAAIASGEVDEGLVRVHVARDEGRLVVRTAESGGTQLLDAAMDFAVVRALGDEADAGRHEALVGLLAETRRKEESGGFRDAPEAVRHVSVQTVQPIVPPEWRTPFLGAANDEATTPLSVASASWRLAVWLGVCVGRWLGVGQALVAMFR